LKKLNEMPRTVIEEMQQAVHQFMMMGGLFFEMGT
jgi:hypothetical protein